MATESPSASVPAPVSPPAPQFAPLPIRQRTVLEILDTSLKLYRRYFGPLIGWSVLVALVNLVGSCFYLLAAPLLYGSVACAIAAAVRGQPISFGQVWSFTSPRFGALLGVILVSSLLFSAILVALIFAIVMLFSGGAYLLSAAPDPVQIVTGILGFILATVLCSVLGAASFAWLTMVPIIACLEDEHRGISAMGRATQLMSGHWKRVFSLSFLLGLSVLVVFSIIGGFVGLLFGGFDLFSPGASENAFIGAILTGGLLWALFLVAWMPGQALVVAVLYLDLRTRKEALDLEWTNYAVTATTPTASGPARIEAPTPNLPLSEASPAPTGFAPATQQFTAANSLEIPRPAANLPAQPEISLEANSETISDDSGILPEEIPQSLEKVSAEFPTELERAPELFGNQAEAASTLSSNELEDVSPRFEEIPAAEILASPDDTQKLRDELERFRDVPPTSEASSSFAPSFAPPPFDIDGIQNEDARREEK